MRVVKSVYSGAGIQSNQLEAKMGNLLCDLEDYTTEVIGQMHLPGSNIKLRSTLRKSLKSLKNYEFDLYERLISFGRTLRILVDSTYSMNKEISNQIKGPLNYLVKTYHSIAYQTRHKEITETAQGLMKDISDDPNEVNFFSGY